MSIPDPLLEEWWRLASGVEGDALAAALADARENPYRSKRALAARVVALYHGEAAATAAAEGFDALFRRREVPEDVPEHRLRADDPALGAAGGSVALVKLMVRTGLATSNADAQRQIQQGAVQVDGVRVEARDHAVATGAPILLQKGKRHFARVIWE
jgi:tyrosyl-tRNA synthetase